MSCAGGEHAPFFRRKPLEVRDGKLQGLFTPVKCPNVDEFVFSPVIAKDWKQHELWDGTYTWTDLLDWHEVASVKYENDRLKAEADEIARGNNA